MDIIIETPKGSRQKYTYDKEVKLFRLKKVLAPGLVFPFDFGFIPGTKGEDGDPFDVLVLSEYQTFPGCVVDIRIAGCLPATSSLFLFWRNLSLCSQNHSDYASLPYR